MLKKIIPYAILGENMAKGTPEMKVKMTSWLDMEIDLSEFPKEISDYVLDQLEDRLSDSNEVTDIVKETEIEKDYTKQILKVQAVIPEIVQKIIEEKEADMEFESKHN
jgi:hypothetical protein